jgi:GNAT superfamily N-acetyltransferase
MTVEEYRDFPRRIGWKHEYYGGEIHITPAHLVVTLVLPLWAREVPAELTIKPVEPADEERMLPAFLAAFDGSMDYAGYTQDDLRRGALRYFKGYFGAVRGRPLAASCLAEEDGELVGAALIKRVKRGPLLDCIFVAPAHQRGGIATVLAGHAVNRLLADGETELYSCCILGNAASLEWHKQFGFTELPDLLVANHRANTYRAEVDRHRRLADLPAEELAELTREADYWSGERSRLQSIADRDFWAVHPLLEE